MPRKPDLIVPIRDRRQRKRYLTLKNFRNATIAFGVLFAAVHVSSELRGTKGDFGRLMQRELPEPVVANPIEVVREQAPAVADATHPDPLLVQPMVRGQWLEGDFGTPQTTETVAPGTTTFPTARAEAAVATGETRVAIVGGTDGVKVVQQERRKPILAGGFGRR